MEEETKFKIGDTIKLLGKKFKVIGYLKKQGSFIFDNLIYMNEEDLEDLTNYGDKIDLVAPGVEVYTTAPNGEYKYFSGTSAATPFVSGAIAALLSEKPNLSPREAMKIVLERADNLGPANRDNVFGYGIVNVKRLLEMIETRFMMPR